MLYFFYGEDTETRFQEVEKLTGGKAAERFDPEHFSEEGILEAAKSSGLFGDKKILLLKDLLKSEHDQVILKNLQNFASSEHTFFVLEDKADKKTLATFQKAGATVKEFAEKEEIEAEKFKIFALSDLFGAKDRKRIWIAYQKALRAGVSAEEIHGILFWQVKNLLLVQNSGKNPGLHPFVYQKTQGFAKNYSHEQLVSLSGELVSLFHEARRVDVPLEVGLERFLLESLK